MESLTQLLEVETLDVSEKLFLTTAELLSRGILVIADYSIT